MADNNPYAGLVEKNPYSGLISDPDKGTPLPANAGVANFIANFAGAPAAGVVGALNLVPEAIRTGLMAGGRYDLANSVPRVPYDSFGTPESIRRGMRSLADTTGIPGLSPDNPTPNSKVGTTQYEFTSRGGFIPGGALATAGSMLAEKALGPDWGMLGAVTPELAVRGYNAARAPVLAAQESRNRVADETLKKGNEAGYVVPPSSANGGWFSRRLESLSGKAAVGQEAASRNQEATNAIARKEADLPENAAISIPALQARREQLAGPYNELGSIDTQARAAIKDLRQVRFDATEKWKQYNATPSPEVLKEAQALSSRANDIEGLLEYIAQNRGRPELVDQLREARKNMAKTFDIERALNVATGDVSAPVLGRMVDKGLPLTGGLETAGKMQQAFPSYMREGEKIPTPGVSKSEALAASLLALGGFSAAGPMGTLAGALPLLSGPARSLVLSKPYQSAVMPSYTPSLSAEKDIPMLLRLGVLSGQAGK